MRFVRWTLQWILSLALAGCAGLVTAYVKPWTEPSLYGYFLYALCSLIAVICINPLFGKLQFRSFAASFLTGALALGSAGISLFEAENYHIWTIYRSITMAGGLEESFGGARIRSVQFQAKPGKSFLNQTVDLQATRAISGPAGVILDDRRYRDMTWRGCDCSEAWQRENHIYLKYHQLEVVPGGADLIVYPLAVRAANVGVQKDDPRERRAALTEAYLKGGYLRFVGKSMDQRFSLKETDIGYTGNGGPEEVSSGVLPVSFEWQSYDSEAEKLVHEMQGESEVTVSLYDKQNRLIVTLTLPTRILPTAHERLVAMTKRVQSGEIVKPFNPFWNYLAGKAP